MHSMLETGNLIFSSDHERDLLQSAHLLINSHQQDLLIVNHDLKIIGLRGKLLSRLMKKTPQDIIGLTFFAIEPGEGSELLESFIEEIIVNRKEASTIYPYDEKHYLLLIGYPMFSEKNNIDKIIFLVRNITEVLKKWKSVVPSQNYHGDESDFPFVIKSENMLEVIEKAKKVAMYSATALLMGESGVGKEMIAEMIHQMGIRKNGPFIKVNCAAIPENLLESELFGYKKGAFTDADPRGKKGYFLQAHKGIIFLDEIGDLSLRLQAKLLRVIQEKEFVPLGGLDPIKVDIQIIAGTNKDLEQMVKTGKFREDLFYRLNVVPIFIPPLRERKRDIEALIYHFLKKYNNKYQRNVTVTKQAVQLLLHYSWPGNVRELKNVIERMVITTDEDEITERLIKQFLPSNPIISPHKPIITGIIPLKEAIESVEEQLILKAMKQYRSVKLAAQALGVSQPTMSRKYQAIRQKLDKQKKANHTNNEHAILEKEIDKLLRSITLVAAASVNRSEVRELIKNPSYHNKAYNTLQRWLTFIREQEGRLHWGFIWIVDEKKRVINLVTDKRLAIAPGEEYTGPPEMMEVVYNAWEGKPGVTPLYNDKFGEWKSCLVPIKDEENKSVIAVLGADFIGEFVREEIKKLKKQLFIEN